MGPNISESKRLDLKLGRATHTPVLDWSRESSVE